MTRISVAKADGSFICHKVYIMHSQTLQTAFLLNQNHTAFAISINLSLNCSRLHRRPRAVVILWYFRQILICPVFIPICIQDMFHGAIRKY